MWTLADAVLLVRRYQKHAMDRGYYLAIAGNVLNRGSSYNDLDIVAVPRDKNSAPERLVSLFAHQAHNWDMLGISAIHNGNVYKFIYCNKYIDLIVLDHVS